NSPGPINVTYRVWSTGDQELITQDHLFTPGADGLVHATKIPAGQSLDVETFEHPGGYSKATASIGFEGDLKTVTLRLSSLGNVSGRVVNYDGSTPVSGASVELSGGAFNGGSVTTLADGSFVFPAIAAHASFRITATALVDGILRKGYVDSSTPAGGGPVNGLVLVMRQQANISGTIRDASGAPVPLAHYWVRELAWPYRELGSPFEPLIAGSNGSFFANNVFTGPFRVSAVSPIDQSARGDLQGTIVEENADRNGLSLVVGAAGTGTVNVTVYDSNSGFTTVPNAEVSLQVSGQGYDFTVTNASGFATFEQIPVGHYVIRAISRAVGRSGVSDGFDVTRDGTANVRVSLTFIGTVRGTIVDADNDPPTPVVGAAVFLRGSGGLDARASTDANGAYIFNAIPEGRFSIEAIDVVSGRHVATGVDYELSSLVQNLNIGALSIERSGTVNLTVSLPNDAGGAGEIAPLVDVTVTQALSYSREQQGRGSMTFNKLFSTRAFSINVRELGGEQRVINIVNSHFAAGARIANVSVVFPTTGSVEVTVLGENEQPQRGVLVEVSDGERSLRVFTGDNGIARVDGLPLRYVVARATSGTVSASDGGTLVSHSTPLHLTLRLGNRIDVTGKVFAEDGVNVPSVGTSVLADVSSPLFLLGTVRMQTRTDANGEYRFGAIPISNTSITITFVGPDEVTAGDRISSFAVPNGQTGELRMRDAKLDATPPRVTSIDPADNANSVSPTASVVVTFSEDLAGVAASSFSLVSTDNNQSTSFAMTSARVNGIFRVTLTPSAKLRSNVVYRVTVANNVHDAAGNPMKSTVGSSFTTVDYTEPRVISTTPSTIAPIPDGTTFRLKFNKPIDAGAFAPNGGGTVKVERLKTYKGELLQPVNVTIALDANGAATLIVAPIGTAIEPSSYYRITVNGARDTQPIPAVQTVAQIFDFFSFDTIAPVVTIPSPLPAGSPLIAGQLYTFVPTITDGAGGAASTDIAFVDWTYPDNTTSRVKSGNFSIAPRVDSTDGTYTLKAKATDLSGNESALAIATFTVAANEAPKNVALTAPASTYLGRTIAAHVAFTDEGTVVTTKLTVTGTKKDGSVFVFTDNLIHPAPNQQISHASVAATWNGADYTIDVPAATLKSGSTLTLTATVLDSVNKTSDPATATVTIAPDGIEPQVTITAPIAETQYSFGTGTTTYAIRATAIDAESGIAHLTIAYDGRTIDLPASVATRDAGGAYLFTTTATVTAKNVDTRIHITATAFDNDGNTKQQVLDVIYKSVGITNVPKAAWITPLDGGALVAAETNVPLKLRIRATAEPLGFRPTVRFESDAFVAAPSSMSTPTSGTDIYEQTVNVNVPASGSFTISAIVDDADPSHQVVLPIAIDAVVPDAPIVVSNFEINEQNLATYSGKTVVVRGAATRLNIDTPATLRNLVVLNGATVGTRDGVRLDATITDRLYVDGDSSIDVSGKGYRGGWRKSDDGTFTNDSPNGITFGGTTVGGATSGASASHAGAGGEDSGSSTNATYGSITAPVTFGAGGAGATGSAFGNTPGGNGGGAIGIRGNLARLVIAGAVRADGESGSGSLFNAGAGGSVQLSARALVTGPATRITANGGDDSGAQNKSRGAGGGRIAVTATERFELDSIAAELQALGGRNATSSEGRTYVDGGAGTLFVLAPGATTGDLIVSSFDDRNTASTHVTRPTPIAGTTTFNNVTIGPRALARFDDVYPATIAIDPTAVAIKPGELPTFTFSSIPASGGEVIRGSSISTTYAARSNAGITSVATTFAPAGTLTADTYGASPLDTTTIAKTIVVPSTASLGAASLTVRITDRAGRAVDVPPVALTVTENFAPTIDKFLLDPSTLV
ncbi:MAG: LamG domain protein jellyroll fold domain protein, partial [Acidobacteria bacterium]|nr:LamG domain protein jellyroll fold domain protein [Acidobacteriota bacterium]